MRPSTIAQIGHHQTKGKIMAGFEFTVTETEFVETTAVNPLAETVKAHVEAASTNPNTARAITVPVADVTKATLLYQKAANELGKTAKLRVKDASGVKAGKPDADGEIPQVGNVVLTFTIVNRQKSRRNKEREDAAKAAAAAAEGAETPEAEVSE